MNLAPIVLFVYNRLDHTRQTIEALQKNDLAEKSIIYIYSDGAKLIDDQKKVVAVRNYLKKIEGFKNVYVIEREKNWGLANNIIDGVTTVIKENGKVIVLEDDIVTMPGFLKFMNEALFFYKDNNTISQISGYVYPFSEKVNEETILLRILGCWGWGTWENRWQCYDHNVYNHIEKLNSTTKIKEFNINGHANFYEQLLDNANGIIYTWAVRWYASWYNKSMLSVYPFKSLVINIGDDNSGVHSKETNSAYRSQTIEYIESLNKNKNENDKVRKSIDKFFKKKFPKSKKSILEKLSKSILFRFVPESRILFNNQVNWELLRNTENNNNLGTQVKINTPYYITESNIGDYTYISKNSHISQATIGKFCSIGPNLICGWGIHPTHGISTHPMFYSTAKQNGMTICNTNKINERKEIIIGNDVFIGANVTILDGVEIGNGAVIGAGAVVSKDIPPYAIAVGNPIEIKKFRFETHIIEKLQKIKWWDKNISTLMDIEAHFFDVEKFLDKYD